MSSGHSLTYLALTFEVTLGLAVFAANSRRPTNRSFLLLNTLTSLWLISLEFVFSTRSAASALWGIRICTFFGLLTLPAFYLLRVSIIYHQETWSQHLRRAWIWFGVAGVCSLVTLTSYAIKEVRMPGPRAPGLELPEPIYGFADNLQLLYLLASVCLLAFLLVRDQLDKRVQGIRRVELQFILLACVTVFFSLWLSAIYEHYFHNAQSVRFAPLRAVCFTVVIAYGITSRGILHVQAAFRLALSNLFLGAYVALLFGGAWCALRWVSGQEGQNFWLALSAAVFTSLVLNATGTPVRRIAKKILAPDIDLEKIVTDVSSLVQSVTILEELLSKFSTALAQAVGSPRITVLLYDETHGDWRTLRSGHNHIVLRHEGAIVSAVRAGAAELALEDLQRRAPTPELATLLEQMDEIGADLILPIRYQNELSGVMIFASRPSGRLYGSSGRRSLQIIAEQLGVAIANSRLYTEARQSQAYNHFLVGHLSCGVIATDPVGGLTVVNPEARRLLGLDELAPPADLDLPDDIARLIPPTLDGNFVGRDEEIILHPGARDEVNLRVSCLPFASEISRLLGAVLVLNDYSAIERLQRQIRQADRLASIGTLASGMAHEIKNPLTALKTFTQLLPKRYGDPEFRSDFALLGGNEILRIERIVNDLLAFARPAPLMIEPLNLHDIITAAVRLVTPQAAKLRIEVRTALHARSDFVAADRDRLQQVLLNLILNALQAGEEGGWVELRTESEEGSLLMAPSIRLDVRDGGRGISKEMLPHIFDPFFTTKSEGTGLGLSVSYNIIAEHRGRLEVVSETGEGTCFSIYLPIS